MLSAPKKIEQGGGGGMLLVGLFANAVVHQGAMAMLQGGFARAARSGQGADAAARAADAASCRVVGLFLGSAVGSATNGEIKLDVQGDEAFKVRSAAGADAVTAAHIGSYCFVVDDETVASNSAGGTRPPAGVVREVGPDGIMVEMGPAVAAAKAA